MLNNGKYGNFIKFREIADVLKERINEGIYRQGALIPSENQFMQEFCVSRITVRNALSLLVNDGYLERSQGKGTAVLSRESKESKFRKGLAFGMLHPDYSDDIPADERILVSGAILKNINLWDANLSMFPFRTDKDQLDYIKEIVARNMVDGLFIGHFGKFNKPVVEWLKSIKIPFVQISSVTLYEKKVTYPLVKIDELETLKETFRMYRENGIRRIHLLGARFGFQVWRTKKLLSLAEIPKDFEIMEFIADHSAGIYSKSCEFAQSLKDRKDTLGFIISNETIAYFDAVSHIFPGISRENILLYRHYGDTSWTQWHNKFSYIDRPYAELGKAAAERMRDIIRKKENGEDFYSPENNQILNSIFVQAKFRKTEEIS